MQGFTQCSRELFQCCVLTSPPVRARAMGKVWGPFEADAPCKARWQLLMPQGVAAISSSTARKWHYTRSVLWTFPTATEGRAHCTMQCRLRGREVRQDEGGLR